MVESKITWVMILCMLAITIMAIYFMFTNNPMSSTVVGIAFVIIMTLVLISTLKSDSKEKKSLTLISKN